MHAGLDGLGGTSLSLRRACDWAIGGEVELLSAQEHGDGLGIGSDRLRGWIVRAAGRAHRKASGRATLMIGSIQEATGIKTRNVHHEGIER